MLRINDSDPIPKDVAELVGTTRENNRRFEDYNSVLERLGLPTLSSFQGRTVLEVGTGSGNALAGAHGHFGSQAHIASLDIDEGALRRFAAATELPVEFQSLVRRRPSDFPGIDVTPVSIETAQLPHQYFDLAYAIWVLYQVKDKFAALKTIIQSVKPGAPIVMVAAGSICTVPQRPNDGLLEQAREFVWTHRATRFSWLTGVRELDHFLSDAGQSHRIESVDGFLSRRFGITTRPSAMLPEFPAGNFAMARPDDEVVDHLLSAPLELIGFVSTKNSAFVPIYLDPEF